MNAGDREVETKYSVHGLFVLPDLVDPKAGIQAVEPRPSLRLRATYFDTPSLTLARAGITLRHRTGEGDEPWTLKLPVAGGPDEGLSRDELSIADPGPEVPNSMLRLLTAVLRGQPVAPVAVLTTDRQTLLLLNADAQSLAEVVDDTVSLVDGRRVVSRFREIEIERGSADDAAAACRAAGRRLLDAGAVAGEQLPKVVRALGPQAQQPSELPAPPEVNRTSPVSDLLLWSLRTGLARLVAADLGVRRGQNDAVHQMRVACRRLRSDLRTFATLLDDDRVVALREELSWLAGALGAARDLEVLRARVARTARRDVLRPLDPAGVSEVQRLLADEARQALLVTQSALDADRYVDLLRCLFDLAGAPQFTDDAGQPCKDALPTLVGRPWRHLARRADRLSPNDPDMDWHRARILSKRARYAAELAAVALGKPAKKTAAAATALQELLGEHQDAVVAAERMLALATTAPGDARLAVTCGRLAERERAQVVKVRAGFKGAWKDVKSGPADRWLEH